MKLASKLGLAFSLLFAFVLIIIASMVYFTTKAAMTRSIENHLNNISDLIKRTVEISIDNNWGQVQKNLILSEQIVESVASIEGSSTMTLEAFDDYNIGTYSVTVNSVQFDTGIGGSPSVVVETLAAIIDAEVTLYRVFDGGLVAMASSIDAKDRGVGHVIPQYAPVYELIHQSGTWIGRDYFSSTWYLTGYRAIRIDDEIEAVLLIAVPQVDLASLRDDILSVEIGQGGFPYIIDTAMNIVIHPDREVEKSNWSLEPYAREIAFSKNGRISYEREEWYIAMYKYVPAMTWIVVAASATDDAYASVQLVGSLMLVIFGLAIVASFATSLLVSRQITKPVADITARFKEISEGEADLNRRITVTSNDEVGQLARYFNRFVDRVRQYNEVENREVALELRDAQINALQAQINPHFLYNTLETVRFMIEMDDQRATTIVQHLADLFRISIGKGDAYVPIEHEIRHVELYSWIHELRYPGRFTLTLDVPDGLRKLFTLKFILQPIVENAIHHGLEQVENGGEIIVHVERSASDVLISVLDNGMGIDPARLSDVREQLRGAPSEARSIGLKNVHERLRLHFGAGYGVTIDSPPEGGTIVRMLVPVLRNSAREATKIFTNK